MKSKSSNLFNRFHKSNFFDQHEQLYTCFSSLFLGSLMFKGNKLLALKFFSQIRKDLKEKDSFDPAFIFLVSLMRISPKLLLVLKRKGRAKKNVPTFISLKKRATFAIK